jgi:siderophore synthetase component
VTGHEQLASAQAGLAEAEQALAEGDADAAIARARSGLEALGEDYAPAEVEDDTTLKVLAAEDAIDQGDKARGAGMLIEMLRTRAGVYAEHHADSIGA